MIQTVTLSQCN